MSQKVDCAWTVHSKILNKKNTFSIFDFTKKNNKKTDFYFEKNKKKFFVK